MGSFLPLIVCGMLDEFSATGMLGFPQEEVMVLERILLQTIKFDLQVEHPYMFLLRYVKQLKGNFGRMRQLGDFFFFLKFRY